MGGKNSHTVSSTSDYNWWQIFITPKIISLADDKDIIYKVITN
jgi:hypothetical protein